MTAAIWQRKQATAPTRDEMSPEAVARMLGARARRSTDA
jgi:hypothetical protein